jgi:hypothetical protein
MTEITEWVLTSLTYDSELHSGTYKECVAIRKACNEYNKDMGLEKEQFEITKETYQTITVKRK